MKYFLVFALTIFTSHANAEMPANWCNSQDGCSPQQQLIWTAFQEASGLVPGSTPGVFTGSCYFLSRWQDPSREAYGVAVFDQKDESLYYGGKFAEFFESNPWKDLTFEQALKEGFVRYEDRFKVTSAQDHGEASVSDSPEHFIFYWFRQNATGTKLYLLGQADGSLRSFCELSK